MNFIREVKKFKRWNPMKGLNRTQSLNSQDRLVLSGKSPPLSLTFNPMIPLTLNTLSYDSFFNVGFLFPSRSSNLYRTPTPRLPVVSWLLEILFVSISFSVFPPLVLSRLTDFTFPTDLRIQWVELCAIFSEDSAFRESVILFPKRYRQDFSEF